MERIVWQGYFLSIPRQPGLLVSPKIGSWGLVSRGAMADPTKELHAAEERRGQGAWESENIQTRSCGWFLPNDPRMTHSGLIWGARNPSHPTASLSLPSPPHSPGCDLHPASRVKAGAAQDPGRRTDTLDPPGLPPPEVTAPTPLPAVEFLF